MKCHYLTPLTDIIVFNRSPVMKRVFILICVFLCFINGIHSEELKRNEVIGVDGERIINHGVHTWIETDDENVLVCKFCGEIWDLSLKDKLQLNINKFKIKLSFRLEIVISVIIGILICVAIIFALIKSYTEDKKRFFLKAEALKDYIRKDAESRNLDKFRIDELLQREIRSRVDYEEIEFIYDKGNLRSKEEIKEYRYNRQYNAFNNSRHLVNTLSALIPFVIVFVITIIICDIWIIGIPLGLIFGFMASVIGGVIGYTINICNAKGIGISENDPCVIEEKQTRRMAIVSGLAAGFTIGKHTKKAIKDIINVDGWKKMK